MEDKRSQIHMEAAGSLTPELEGAPASGHHGLPQRTRREAGRTKASDTPKVPRDKGR